MTQAYKPQWHHTIWRWLYNLLLLLLLPLALLKLVLKREKTEGQANKNRERFGFIGKPKQNGILIHCVSMGEVNAAKQLVAQIEKAYPDKVITISTTSTTGAKQARAIFKDRVQHVYLAFDIPIFVWLFFHKLAPSLVIVTEVEIWPNMLHQCYKRQVPAVLVNARMSSHSLKNYEMLAKLFRPCLRKFTLICAQGQQDFDNFLALGVYKSNLKISNNMKFDLLIDQRDTELAQQLKTKLNYQKQAIFIAGSTHDSEELICIDNFKRLREQDASIVLVVVPRHPHRFDKVAQLCLATGFTTVRVSELELMGELSNMPDIVLVDTMGMLNAFYSFSTFAFVGGSFVNKGGHNALEPSVYGVPSVMGPSIFNNPVICETLASSGGLALINTPDEMTSILSAWLTDNEARKAAGSACQEIVTKNAGAVKNTLAFIQQVYP
ncbi:MULTISPECIES: 3-deoxy-D-manno-octulosonic acid transferase [Alteromonadaceae]|uniref:3-deoxy-D-manno-octulosonic acid transferase n=1 Tax=Brumicola blandensis TaxID=3075611 RepID=A0AAW8R2G3_9ALTE|nr:MULTISPECIES: 3-deoxy-D-manno-octulosonic acid transferase [unclassified Alteromonas]MDT0582280.1 3-deoxy-D-manno-octulosonic acid transferase [Alteromonas sp. W409]MDT0628501.1 3-deoxy-D-manno-octulosonic acid transferase [Alteromonas sp. W364]